MTKLPLALDTSSSLIFAELPEAPRCSWIAGESDSDVDEQRREHGWGASEAPSLYNEHPYASFASLVFEKRGEIHLEADAGDTARGRYYEGGLLDWLENEMEEPIVRLRPLKHGASPRVAIRRTDLPMFASPDGLFRKLEAGDVGVEGAEAKVVRWQKAHEWAGGPPMKVQIQCQHSMAVTGAKRWHVAVDTGEFERIVVERDPVWIEKHVALCQDLWNRFVVGREEPTLDGHEATLEALKALRPRTLREDAKALPPDSAAWRDAYWALEAEEARIAEARRALKAKFMDCLRGHTSGLLPDGGLVTYKKRVKTTYVPTTIVKSATEYDELRIPRAK